MAKNQDTAARQRPPIGELLRNLRGDRTLREVEQGAGIPNTYLSNCRERRQAPRSENAVQARRLLRSPTGRASTGSRAAATQQSAESTGVSALDIHRSFDFLMSDPSLRKYERPSDRLSTDTQRFIVQIYEHFTGKRLLLGAEYDHQRTLS